MCISDNQSRMVGVVVLKISFKELLKRLSLLIVGEFVFFMTKGAIFSTFVKAFIALVAASRGCSTKKQKGTFEEEFKEFGE